MNSPNIHFKEVEEVGMYEAVIEDIKLYRERIQCLSDEEGNKLCDTLLEEIEQAYKEDYISDEMVRYLTGKLLQGS